MRSLVWRDRADDADEYGRPALEVEWRGGATFTVWCDGMAVDTFTAYRDAGDGQPPTIAEAYRLAVAYLARHIAPDDWSAGPWPGARGVLQ